MRIAILDDYQSVALSFPAWAALPSHVELVAFRDHVEDAELVARLRDFDAVCRVRERTPFPEHVLRQLPRLKLVLCSGLRNAGSVDLKVAEELGITVCSTGSFGVPTLELTWALILALFRNIHREAASVRAGGWQIGIGSGLEGKILAVLGLGRYGSRVARIGQAFGMGTIAWSPNLTQERASPLNVRSVTKTELFSSADVVSIHMPESPRSIGIVGADDINRMKPTALLINTSRAPLVDQTALINALSTRRIGGAGLDVFDVEPLPSDHPYRYLPNVVATPHIGYVTRENYEIFFREMVENIIAFVEGQPIRTLRPGGE